jgi:acetylornithine deacetylase/succinyl-diaminopimelate desuccinylase-like protein
MSDTHRLQSGVPEAASLHEPGSLPRPGNLSDPASLADLVIERTIALSEVPAPPLEEHERARIVRDWWLADRLRDIHTDNAGNIRAQLRPGDHALPAVLICAHLDTVFGPGIKHGVVRTGGRLTGPGVGDNTVAVCSLSALNPLLPSTLRHPVWIVATVGEEGLGNLAGIRALLNDPPGPVRAVIALEGNYLGRVNLVGVGSTRWQVTITGPGGHAWENPERPSAVHEAARLITGLTELARLSAPKATVNIGRIEGGESVNSRAERARFLVDLRSADHVALQQLRDGASAILHDVTEPIEVTIQPIGERPAGALDPEHPLAAVAVAVLHESGIPPRLTAASTDANAAYPFGIPALTLGITTGDSTHTAAEWIDVDPVADGLTVLATTIARLDEQEW